MSDQNERIQELQEELTDSSEYVRRAAVEQLARLGPITFEMLLKTLSDRAALVREGAALALSEFSDARAIAPLIPLLRDSSEDVRRAARRALVKAASAEVRPLIWALKDPDKNVRQSVSEILAEAGTLVVEPLIAALQEENVLVRCNSAWALGKIRDVSATPYLIRLLRDTEPLAACRREVLSGSS